MPFLVAFFYAFSLLFLFPLLGIPIVLLVLLGFMASRYMVDRVTVERTGYGDAELALWTIRRFGWVLGTQPGLYGLILLSRREWALGGVSLAVALITAAISECITVGLHQRTDNRRLSAESKKALDLISRDMASSPSAQIETVRPRASNASMMDRLTTLLPGYSRLPPDCRLPLDTEAIDDLLHSERASAVRPELAKAGSVQYRRFYHDPTESLRGLIYPPEVLAPVPVIWLPNDGRGVALRRAADLQRHRGLAAIVDPDDNEEKSRRDTCGR